MRCLSLQHQSKRKRNERWPRRTSSCIIAAAAKRQRRKFSSLGVKMHISAPFVVVCECFPHSTEHTTDPYRLPWVRAPCDFAFLLYANARHGRMIIRRDPLSIVKPRRRPEVHVELSYTPMGTGWYFEKWCPTVLCNPRPQLDIYIKKKKPYQSHFLTGPTRNASRLTTYLHLLHHQRRVVWWWDPAGWWWCSIECAGPRDDVKQSHRTAQQHGNPFKSRWALYY